MVQDSGGGDSGPAGSINGQSTASQNFDQSVGGDVQANIPDLTTYAAKIQNVSFGVLGASSGPIGNMGSYSATAFVMSKSPDSLGIQPEAALANDLNTNAASQFKAFFTDLQKGLQYIASASQVVADIYSTSDAESSATLNDINFAFGDPGAKRPDGLPKYLGQTFQDYAMQHNTTASGPEAASADPSNPNPYGLAKVTHADGTGYNVTTYTYPDGSKLEVSASPTGDGGIVNTTTIYGADGSVVTSQSTSRSQYKTVQTDTHQETVLGKDGKPTTKTVTGTTTTVTDPKTGDQTITTESGGTKKVTHVSAPPPTSDPKPAQDPLQQQINQGKTPHVGSEDHAKQYGYAN